MSYKTYRVELANEDGNVPFFPGMATGDDPKSPFPFNPYSETANPICPVGTVVRRGIEEWWYCKNGASALATLGTPIQSAAAIHAEADDDIVVGAASAIGVKTVTLTSTANLAAAPLTTKDGFKDGFLIVNDAAGQGQMYQIEGHAAASGTDTFVVTLYEALTVALTISSEVGLIQHPCMNVIATAAVVSGMFIGVNLIAVTASYYFWAKVKGPAPAVAQAAIAKGTYVVVGTTAAKFDPSAAVTTELIVGEPLTPGVADTEQFIVYLYGR